MMQLIEESEPASMDINKTMSSVEEVFEGNQMNGSIADIQNDVFAKISPCKGDTVSKSIEDVNTVNTNIEQIEKTVKNFNGVVKTNGDAEMEDKTLALDNNKKETEVKEFIENGSSANGESNGSLSENKSCKSPTSFPADISTMDVNKNLEERLLIDSNQDPEKKTKPTNYMKISDTSLNDKDSTSVVSIDKIPTFAAMQTDVCSEKEVSNADNLKDIGISIDNEDMAQNASAFSPNSDTNEKEVNISAQLQQLEDDESMEEDFVNPLMDVKISTVNEIITSEKVPELNNDRPACSEQKQSSEIQSTTTTEHKNDNEGITMEQEQNYIIDSLHKSADTHTDEASAVPTEELSTENKQGENIVLEKELKVTFTENIQNCLDTSLDGASAIEKVSQDKLSRDVVNQNIHDIPDNKDVTKGVTPVVIENDSIENNQEKYCSKNDMEVETINQIQEQKQENSSNMDIGVDKTSVGQKYITVKKFTDMTYPVPTPDDTIDKNEASGILDDKQPTEKDQSQQNDVMEVDIADVVSVVTPETSNSLDTSSKLSHIEKKIEVENNIEVTDTDKEEKQQIPIKEKYSDNVVMEIDDIDDVSALEKRGFDTEVVNDTSAEVKHSDETVKQDSVINIIDNDDEEKSDAPVDTEIKNDEKSEVISIDDSVKDSVSEESKKHSSEVEIMDNEDSVSEESKKHSSEVEIMDNEETKVNVENNPQIEEKIPEKAAVKQFPIVCKLSNTMDILSDEEDDPPFVKPSEENKTMSEKPKKVEEQNKCINLDDDDDIMFIEDTNSQDPKDEENNSEQQKDRAESQTKKNIDNKVDSDDDDKKISTTQIEGDSTPKISEKDDSIPIEVDSQPKVEETKPDVPTDTNEAKPLITKSFLKSVTKNLADMTRNELEDFCILKLVESVVDKSNLNEIKSKMKTMAQTVEDLRKKSLALTKQNRDLQVVVKTVQEDQKKRNANPMMPMKITRSVGMQVVLGAGDKNILKKKIPTTTQPPPMTPTRPVRNMQSPKTQKPIANNIPVPRLVPASSPTVKSPVTPVNTATKPTAPVRNTTPQRPEKRPHSKSSPASSVTVDLTDDEPPAKITTKNPAPPVRLVPSQNLMAPKTRPQFGPTGNSPRKVYIPISSNSQNMRPGQAVIKNFVPTPRARQPSVVRMQTVRLNQAPSANRHPAPLPDAMKQYQPPTWKALPPAPDLKLSKVDNGIVISWKFEGYQPDTYEEVASFQLYAYQETPAPPSTALWKKIGDIKALPLPMACTLTQFMSGFKYYFAVRAIDVRSRIGPFSLPGSIMLISKS